MVNTPERIEERLVLRMAPARKDRIRKASDFLGQTMTTFTDRALDEQLEKVEAQMARTEQEAA